MEGCDMPLEIGDIAAPVLGAVLGSRFGSRVLKNKSLGTMLGIGGGLLQNKLLGEHRGILPATAAFMGPSVMRKAISRPGVINQMIPPAVAAAAGIAGGTALGGGMNLITGGHGTGTGLGGLGGATAAHYAGYNPLLGAALGAVGGNILSRYMDSGKRQQQRRY
jgi:hypothetical protein